jgi:RNA polymerase sigma factor (sigma-70 family)
MRVIRSRATEDDVVSEVWLRFYSSGSFERFDDRGPGSLRRYLSVILDRAMIDMVRRAKAGKREGGSANVSLEECAEGRDPRAGPQVESKDPTPTSGARASELGDLCKAVLDDREYETWRLIEVEGRLASEVAEALGVTPAAVRGVLFRARFKLISTMQARDSKRGDK